MAESPTFSGFSNDAADTFAKVIAQIKSDMAAIEASAKNIESSLSKASRSKMGGGSAFGAQNSGGSTGFSKSTMATSLGAISGKGTAALFAGGALAGHIGGAGALTGGIAAAALPDLILRPQQALDREAAKFGASQSTGDFGTFNRMLSTAKNSFNVQNQEEFQNTLVYGTQRAGMVGLNGGGTVGERRAATQIGDYNTLAGLAGIDQSQVIGAMGAMNSSQSYYASMAAGVMTRNPVTGETIGATGQVNQIWERSGLGRMNQDEALKQIDINYGDVAGAGRQQLREQYGDNEAAIQMAIEGLRMRARQGGSALSEGQLVDQAKDSGILGGKDTQGMESTRGLESSKMDLTTEYLEDATSGIKMAADEITKAVDTLTELEGPLRTMVGAYTTMANALGVAQTEIPGATKGLTDFFSGLPGFLTGLMLGGSKGSLLARGAGLLGRGAMALIGGGAAATTAVVAGGALAVGGAAYLGWRASQRDTPEGYQGYLGSPGSPNTSSSSASSSTTGAARPTSNADGGGARTVGAHGYSKGDWFVESDQDARIHYGEMILPSRVATAVRKELDLGKTSSAPSSSGGGRGSTTVNIYLTVQKASDQEAISFAHKVKRLIDDDRELFAVGSGRLAHADR